MIEPVSTIQPMTDAIVKPTALRPAQPTSSTESFPGVAERLSQARPAFFALANRPLPYNELSNPAYYALTPLVQP